MVSYDVLNDALNHSDHLPVSLTIDVTDHLDIVRALNNEIAVNDVNTARSQQRSAMPSLRWDQGGTDQYYNATCQLLYPIFSELIKLDNSTEIIDNCVIEHLYTVSVKAMLHASHEFVPCFLQNSQKFWWNSDLTELKKQSIMSHNVWSDLGRPLQGTIFETKNRHKALYKLAIKKAKSLQGSAISDDLHEALATKDSKCFWKTWKNKVCSHTQNRIRVLGNLSDSETVKEFATFFEQANAPNSV